MGWDIEVTNHPRKKKGNRTKTEYPRHQKKGVTVVSTRAGGMEGIGSNRRTQTGGHKGGGRQRKKKN